MQMVRRQQLLKLGVFMAGLMPLAVLAWQTVTGVLLTPFRARSVPGPL